MNLPLRRLGWSSVALLGLVGCDATPPAPPPPSAPTPAEPKPAPSPERTADKNVLKSLPVDPIKPADTPAVGDPIKPADAPSTTANTVKLTDDELAEVKKLPPADQALALAQGTCPVSGGHLGSMDIPIRQVVKGRTFFLCCSGCEDKVKENPDEVLAKLDKK